MRKPEKRVGKRQEITRKIDMNGGARSGYFWNDAEREDGQCKRCKNEFYRSSKAQQYQHLRKSRVASKEKEIQGME